MSLRRRNACRAVAILLIGALLQITLQLSFAESSSLPSTVVQAQGILGRVSTKGKSPILVNGNKATSGDSVVPGAMVETPADTEATIELGPLGSIELRPATRVRIDYQCPDKQNYPDPESCRVNLTLFSGCLVSNYRQGTHHEIENENEVKKAESDRDREQSGGGVLKICADGQQIGAAADGGGLGKKGLISILSAAIVLPTTMGLIASGGDNPSNSTPP